MSYNPGERVSHADFGHGVVISLAGDYAQVFFPSGERQVPLATLSSALSHNETVVTNIGTGQDRATKAWLCWKAHELPMAAAAAQLTSAKIDLLPHQVVLTHKIASASPRRFLIADEVGLGKTIETALVLRELASRGELNRALMVVPAGLVNNWHEELNDVFNLNFEVFGREGDVSDRRSNAFAKHNLLIASIDTLKRPERINKILEAPRWDLVVFDEAHHCTAYKQGGKSKKTQNYKLAEALRDHTRDMLLLSATPHQGDHFRFWKLIDLLDPTLFSSEHEMVDERHRLNPVIFRRTKADACRADGSTLFARRWVHTEAFSMSADERGFYHALNDYLRDGFALAKQQGGKAKALGFVMTIFQKIAASSFAAVHRTLRRRLIALTVHEGVLHDQSLDIDLRDSAFNEARELIRAEFSLGKDRMADVEIDQFLNEMKRKLLKRLDEEELSLASDSYSDELKTAAAEDAAMNAVSYALPEERSRIKSLLALVPEARESKVEKLVGALGVLWKEDENERVVIFATYLGTVEMISEEIEKAYAGKGVVVLKGGDHGSKVAAERRFKQADGPRIMICTAAGREGINLQHARVLFNFDLPWNPMDLEQRIGRIHRYGQKDTAQVYNLVLGDTIEGKVFLLLDEKLQDIAKALGKVDEQGNVAEDLRSQILGQLTEQINYQSLYAEALADPELQRTSLELEAAMDNAKGARTAVFELFQDLDRFSLDDYAPLADTQESMDDLVRFIQKALPFEGEAIEPRGSHQFALMQDGVEQLLFTTQREEANDFEKLHLIGLDHPRITDLLEEYRALPAEEIGIAIASDYPGASVAIWEIQTENEKGHLTHSVVKLALDSDGARLPALEKSISIDPLFLTSNENIQPSKNIALTSMQAVLERELLHRRTIVENQSYRSKLIGLMVS
jgi:superfamily II DNA or RNA helicase